MSHNLTLRAKLLVALGLIAVTLIGMATVSALSLNRLKTGTLDLAESMLPAVDFVVQADRDMQQALVAERSVLYVKAGAADFDRLAKEQAENIGQARSRVEKYLGVAVSDQGKEMAERYLRLHRDWADLSRKVTDLAGGTELTDKQSALALSFGDAAVRFGAARDLLDSLTNLELQHAQGVVQQAESVAATSFYAMVSAAGVGVALSLALMLMFPGMVVNPLERLTERLNEFSSGQGDLTARLEVDRQDEIGVLAGAFNGFLGSLHTLIADVGMVSPKLAEASSRLSVAAERSSAKTTQQRRETEQVVTAINEMATSIQDIARNASEAANMARAADAQAGRGDEVVTQTISQIGRLASSVDDLGGVMQRLNADSQNIGSVLDVIRGIAEQTNLLALNAAIEAARAGEQGRGFAVVADEVRTLASRTQESTLEIQAMVERLQAAADEAVSTVQVGRNVAQGTVEHATSTRDVLDAIRTSVSAITGMSMQIASAVEQQGAVAAEVDRNVTRISQISEENSSDAAHLAASGEELAGLASELQSHVGRFRV